MVRTFFVCLVPWLLCPPPPRSSVGAPVVGEVDGEYSYNAKKHILNWRLALIDASTSHGSMEFAIAGMPSDFFPVKVSFASSKPYCNIEVSMCLGDTAILR